MKGIDIPIEMQRLDLETISGLTMYGRVYDNRKRGNSWPERYVGNGNYKEVLLNDRKSIGFFYPVNPANIIGGASFTQTVHICFAVNLEKLYPSITDERQDQYFILDVKSKINRYHGFEVQRIITGLEAFDFWSENVKEIDNMHKYFLLRVETELTFNYNNC